MRRIDLADVAFCLVARFSTISRLENAVAVCEFLTENFHTNIYLWEFDEHSNHFAERIIPDSVHYKFHSDYDPIFHRTRHINEMIKQINEPYVSVWDVDVLAPVSQIQKTVDVLRSGCDFAYPYEYYFLDTSTELRNLYLEEKDISILEKYKEFMHEMYSPNPVGGAFFAKRESYVKSGIENERFYGWGFEDGERLARWNLMGMSVARIPGILYHLTHSRDNNSTICNQDEYLVKNREYLSVLRQTR